MPNTGRPLPIQCPKCQHDGPRVVIKSYTVMTLTCASCGHFWATAISAPSRDAKKAAELNVGGPR
jgi:uncharacterized Zn finger protein